MEINEETDSEYEYSDTSSYEEQTTMMVRTNEVGEEVVNYYEEYHSPYVDLLVHNDGRYELIDEDVIAGLDIPPSMKGMEVFVRGRNYVIYYNNYQEYRIVGEVDKDHFMTRAQFKIAENDPDKEDIEDYNHYEDYETKVMLNWIDVKEEHKEIYLEYFQYCRSMGERPTEAEAMRRIEQKELINMNPIQTKKGRRLRKRST